VLADNGELEQAAQLWLNELEENPGSAQAHYQLVLIRAITNPEQAAEYLDQAASLEPALSNQARRIQDALRQASFIKDTAYQLTITGQALSSLEEWGFAQAALEMAVEKDPNYAEAWAYLGEVRQHNKLETGFDALQTAIALNPKSYAANLFMSIYWNRNDQPNRALPYLQNALSLDPNNLTLKEDLAHTLVQAGLVELGFEMLEELTSQDPDRAEVWMMLARLSIENTIQIEDTGLPAARQAVLLAPDHAAAMLLLGRAYLLIEDAVLAERFLVKCTQLDPKMPDPHLFLAIIYLNQENQGPAKPHLQTALSLAEASGDQAIADQAKQFLQRYFP
jgi:Tfp pilus assembly protein PilF